MYRGVFTVMLIVFAGMGVQGLSSAPNAIMPSVYDLQQYHKRKCPYCNGYGK
jgi:hypothetical protein